jgi:hypothetical protein
LSAEGLKEMASEVADTFTSEVKGTSEASRGASIVPDSPASRSGQSFGREHSERDVNQTSDAAQAGFGPGRVNR